MMDALCAQFESHHQNSTPYRSKINGIMEATNKNIKKILQKMTETYQDWHEKLSFALFAYRTYIGPENIHSQIHYIFLVYSQIEILNNNNNNI